MIMRAIDKETLVRLASGYTWDPIPREVVDYWIKMYGKNITIEPEETKETDSSHTTRACDSKSENNPGLSDVQPTGGAQECEENTTPNNDNEEG